MSTWLLEGGLSPLLFAVLAPIGFLVAYRLGRGVGTAALGLGTSLLIEATQGTGLDLTILVVVTFLVEVGYLLVGEARGWEGGNERALMAIQGVVAVALLLVLPMVRADRATPAQATV